MSRGATLACALAATLACATANADAIAYREDCPPGTATDSHMRYCMYRTCRDGSRCRPGQVCRVVALCEYVHRFWSTAGHAGSTVSPYEVTVRGADQTCETPCPEDTTCVAQLRCVDADVTVPPIPEDAALEPPPLPPLPPRPGCASCATPAASSTPWGWIVAGGIALLVALARTRRRR